MLPSLASSITKAASKQTYYTIRFLVDRERVDDAYRAYAYFRWLDDILDGDTGSVSEPRVLLDRQISLLESCYLGKPLGDINTQEKMLVELVQHDTEENSGLQSYLRNMMQVLDFDVRRRGRLISQDELNSYTRWLAIAVTEALHFFIGHDQPSPQHGSRYMAVSGAHIAHLLRDTLEDVRAGYFNIPREYLLSKGINPRNVESDSYRAWIEGRVNQARACFESGKGYLAQVKNIRCRIAGYAYIARFEVVLDAIERTDYSLAPEYHKGRGLGAGMRLSGSVLSLAFFPAIHK